METPLRCLLNFCGFVGVFFWGGRLNDQSGHFAELCGLGYLWGPLPQCGVLGVNGQSGHFTELCGLWVCVGVLYLSLVSWV